jgi:phage terminase small subunit
MGRLRSWKRELFARAIAEGKEPRKAYGEAGYKLSSAACRNYNRLLNAPDVIALIDEYKKERHDRARAARVPIGEVLATLDARGILRVADFFDVNQAGILAPCNLRQIPVEISMALLRLLSEALGILIEIKAASRTPAVE